MEATELLSLYIDYLMISTGQVSATYPFHQPLVCEGV